MRTGRKHYTKPGASGFAAPDSAGYHQGRDVLPGKPMWAPWECSYASTSVRIIEEILSFQNESLRVEAAMRCDYSLFKLFPHWNGLQHIKIWLKELFVHNYPNTHFVRVWDASVLTHSADRPYSNSRSNKELTEEKDKEEKVVGWHLF